MRKIKILTAGPIRPMGMVHGPILTPWKVSDDRIREFLKAGLNVVEVAPNGREKTLTLTDLMINNTTEVAPEQPKVEAPKVEVPEAPAVEPVVEEPVVEDIPETVDEPVEVAEETVETEKTHNKKNKHKK